LAPPAGALKDILDGADWDDVAADGIGVTPSVVLRVQSRSTE